MLESAAFCVEACRRHLLHHLATKLQFCVVSSRRAGRRGGGGGCPRGKLSRLSFETKCCGGFRHPAGTVFGS